MNKVREPGFIMVRDRQVNKFNRLVNKINNRDGINKSPPSTSSGNQAQPTMVIIRLKAIIALTSG